MQPATFSPHQIFLTFEAYLQTTMKNVFLMSVQLDEFFSYSVHMHVFAHNFFKKSERGLAGFLK